MELVVERARERHPGVRPRIISDNGPQFIAKDFKSYIRLTGMTHVRTSPYYPQSNGKIVQPGYSSRLWASAPRAGGGARRWHKTIKSESIRIKSPSSLEEARRTVAPFVDHYNHRRLHAAIGYVAPADRLADKQEAIWANRDRKLALARERRAQERQQTRATESPEVPRRATA